MDTPTLSLAVFLFLFSSFNKAKVEHKGLPQIPMTPTCTPHSTHWLSAPRVTVRYLPVLPTLHREMS